MKKLPTYVTFIVDNIFADIGTALELFRNPELWEAFEGDEPATKALFDICSKLRSAGLAAAGFISDHLQDSCIG